LLLAGVVVAGLIHGASYWCATSDDAFISLRYAQNLATGRGLVYNSGLSPVEGFSNPLFTVLCAFLLLFSIPPVWVVKCIGLASFLAAMLLSIRLVGAIDERAPPVSMLAAPSLLAASSHVALWSVAGLETVFYAALVSAATAATIVEQHDRERVRSPLLFVLVAATRPEGVLLAAVAAGWQWWSTAFSRRVFRHWTLGFALPCAVLVAARYGYYDAFTPNTFHAKVFVGWQAAAFGGRYLARFATTGGGGALIVLAAAGWTLLVRSAQHRQAALLIGALIAAQCAFIVIVGGDFMPGYRFVLPVYPLLCVLAAIAVGRMVPLLGGARAPVVAAAAIAVVCALSYGQQGHALTTGPGPFWLLHERPWPSYVGRADLSGTWLEGYQRAGRYVRQHAGPDDLLAVTEAGVVPFYAGLTTIDLLGLNDRQIAGLWKSWKAASAAAAQSEQSGAPNRYWIYDIASYALSQEPRWVVLDGYVHAADGSFTPRVEIGRWLMQHIAWSSYREVFQAYVCGGLGGGIGPKRIVVVFERID